MAEGESYKAINARVMVAIDLINDGRPNEALRLLERLSDVMPCPEIRHLEAAAFKQNETRSNGAATPRGFVSSTVEEI